MLNLNDIGHRKLRFERGGVARANLRLSANREAPKVPNDCGVLDLEAEIIQEWEIFSSYSRIGSPMSMCESGRLGLGGRRLGYVGLKVALDKFPDAVSL